MPKSYQVGETRYDFPDNYSDDQVRDILVKQGVIKQSIVQPAAATQPSAQSIPSDHPIWESLKGAWDMSPFAALKSIYDNTVHPDTPKPGDSLADIGKKIATMTAGPIGSLIPALLDAHKQQFLSAVEAAKQGRYSEAAGHGLAAALPAAGPAAAHLADTLGGVPVMPPDQTSQYDGPPRPPNPARAAGEAAMLLGGPQILKGAGKAAGVAGNVAAAMEGKLTGAGGEAIRTMFKNPTPEAIAAMRGKVQPTDIVNDVRAAIENAMAKRSSDYLEQQGKLKDVTAPVDIPAVGKTIENGLKRFRVDRADAWPEPEGGNGAYTPEQIQGLMKAGSLSEENGVVSGPSAGGEKLDFSRSPISPSAQGDIVAVTKLVKNWPDRSPLGIDALIRRVSDYYSDNGQARAFVQSVKKSLQEDLSRQHPEYGKMVGDYAQASELINQAQRELSTGNKNPGVAVRKLTYALNQNNSFRQLLLEGLQQFSNTDLKGSIAGQHLNPVMPGGIVGPMHATAAVSSLSAGHPGILAYLALTSPRVVGELAAAAGKASGVAGPVLGSPAAVRGAGVYSGATSDQEQIPQ